MYANVVVLTYQPPEIKSYTYEVPKNLEGKVKIGQLVEVPFGKRTPFGVLLETGNKKPETIKVKPITSIVFSTPILFPYQVKLLEWLSFYYRAPMVNCLEAILPELPSSHLIVHSSQQIANKAVNRQPSTVNQTLVLVPNINRIPETLAQFPKAKDYIIYHSGLTKSQKFAAWQRVLLGQVDFIFGSRSAIFLPCPNLSKVIIFDEHDNAYKDERSPYFDTLTVVEKIHQLTGIKIEIIDSAPKITTYLNHQKDLKLTRFLKIKTRGVSMAAEKMTGNFSPISQTLAVLLQKNYQRGGRSLLFLNKKVESGQLSCRDCRYQTFARVKPQTCPNCASQNLWFYSLNINTLASVVRNFVPQAHVNLIAEGVHQELFKLLESDRPRSRKPQSRRPVTRDQLPAIDIATASIFYAPVLQRYEIVAHISLDSAVSVTDFTTGEKVFSQITNLRKLTKPNGTLIIQTSNIEAPYLRDAIEDNFKTYFERQVAEREALNFPPRALFVKLTLKLKSNQKTEQVADETARLLKEQNKNPNIFILGPYKPILWRPYPVYNIILKRKLDSYDLPSREKAIRELLPLLENLARGWQITVEPDTLN